MKQLVNFGLCLLLSAPALADHDYVVTGSFESKASAQEQLVRVRDWLTQSPATQPATQLTASKAELTEATVQGEIRFRVTIGPFDTAASAEQTQHHAKQQGFTEAWTYAHNSSEQAVPTTQPTQTASSQHTSEHPNESVRAAVSKPLSKLLSRQRSVEISRFVYDAPALDAEVASLLLAVTGKPVETSALLATKDSINQLYVTNGFVNTGMVIPDQQIRNGELKLDFISGGITDVQISSRLRQKYIESRLEIGEPFNLVRLQQSLKLLEQDPLVSRIDARVAPGANPGEAMIALDVETTPRFSLEFDVANDRSPSIGSENATLTFRASNLSGWGETYQMSSSVTEGLDAQDATIYLPLTHSGTSLQIQYALSDSSVIEEPFNDIDVESETESLSVMLNLPIRKTLSRELSLQLTLEARRNQTNLLGQPFSFSEGAINGESRVAPVRLAISYTEQNINDSLAARFSISRGTSKFDATNNSALPDGQFTSYLAQAQYSKLLAERVHITAKVLAQHAADPLLSIEKYALGGITTVRGYRQNQVVRDNAYLASLEAHYRPELPIWVDLIGFVDWGRGENHDDSATSGKLDLASIGVGIVVKHWQGLSLELYLAHGFDDFTASEHDLQDDGVHIRLGYHHEF
ncbi:MAG: hemolysin activation/secretion protein [Candidatus Azotimanducaceae bacterium]|jgi:hemolysin activation/secretion protein